MKSTQFCYWLQGSFELNDTRSFNAEETKIIKNHLDLVFQHDNTPNAFCSFLRGYFVMSKPDALDENVTQVIRDELTTEFKQNIDSSYPVAEQKTLKDIHNGKLPPGLRAMC